MLKVNRSFAIKLKMTRFWRKVCGLLCITFFAQSLLNHERCFAIDRRSLLRDSRYVSHRDSADEDNDRQTVHMWLRRSAMHVLGTVDVPRYLHIKERRVVAIAERRTKIIAQIGSSDSISISASIINHTISPLHN